MSDNSLFVNPEESLEQRDLDLKIEIVKELFEDKQLEIERIKSEEEDAAKRQYIMSIIEEKQKEDLKNLPIDELKKLVQ